MDQPLLALELAVDPWAAAAALSGRPGTLLLHTQRPWQGTGRSALLFDPRWVLTAPVGLAPRWQGDVPTPCPPDHPVAELPQRLAAAWGEQPGEPVFAGIAGMLGYDLGPLSFGARAAPAPFRLPDAWLAAYDGALLFGGGRPPQLVAADLHPWVPRGQPLRARWEQLAALAMAAATTQRDTPCGPERRVPPAGMPSHSPQREQTLDERWYRRAFAQVRQHLLAGDVYQINLTGWVSHAGVGSPWRLFEHQARSNPVPFAAFLRLEDAAVTCHSPERLMRLAADLVETAPIKGTARAGAVAQLQASVKDRAEHIMIVDLARNDLGRSCQFGSVRVEELMAPLPLSHLVHLVSRVRGRVLPARRHLLLSELFPGGSITGAPKRRAMEIIARVEQSARGPYTGSFGYADRLGNADWNIAIRTAVWQQDAVHFGCGGGVVLDSDCDRELEEAALKARSFSVSLQESFPAPTAPARTGAERRP